MNNALVVGGSNGIGLAIAEHLFSIGYNVSIIDKNIPSESVLSRMHFEQFDLTSKDYSIFNKYDNINLLMITAGFGRLALFRDIKEEEIENYFKVNAVPIIRIIHHFYNHLANDSNFYCGVMVSIAGFLSSPFFSVYGATKASLRIFIESVNVELEKEGSSNKILNISPGHINGTHFNGGSNISNKETYPLAKEIITHLLNKEDLFIPKYEEIYKEVLKRYHDDFRAEGSHSYEYKLKTIKK